MDRIISVIRKTKMGKGAYVLLALLAGSVKYSV